MKSLRFLQFLVLFAVLCSFGAIRQSAAQAPEAPEAPAENKTTTEPSIDYQTQIKPIIDAKCYQCHGNAEDQEGTLNFDELETLDDFIVKGDHAGSDLYKVLISDDEDELMPPPSEVEDGVVEALTRDEIILISKWIDEGADFETALAAEGNEQIEDMNLGIRIWRFVGVLHPALVHFPVALFVVGAVFVVFCGRNLAIANEATFYCLTLGMLGAIVAAATGWSMGLEKPAEDIFDFSAKMFWHRWAGISVAVLSFLVWVLAYRQRSEDYADGGGSWKLGVLLLAGLVSFAGYQGGELSYGDGHYYKKMEKYLPEVIEQIEGDKNRPLENPESGSEPDTDAAESSGSDDNTNDEPADGDQSAPADAGEDSNIDA